MNWINRIRKLLIPSSMPEEWLDLGNDIASLSQRIISSEEIYEAEQLTIAITSGGKRKKKAISILQKKIGLRPKRPIYYVTLEYLPCLPHHTREIMRYLGDYIDGLVKCVATDFFHNKKHMKRSLASNLYSLHGKLDEAVFQALAGFDKIIYTPAKHDFNVIKREHRFTCREVVFACLITVKLREKLKTLSPLTQQYTTDNLPKEYW